MTATLLTPRLRDAAYEGKWLQEDSSTCAVVVLTRDDQTVHVTAAGAYVYRGNALSHILRLTELPTFLED